MNAENQQIQILPEKTKTQPLQSPSDSPQQTPKSFDKNAADKSKGWSFSFWEMFKSKPEAPKGMINLSCPAYWHGR